MIEMWKDVKGFESRYEVSEYGDVRSKKTGKFMTKFENNKGYLRVVLFDGQKNHNAFVHRLVAEAFCERDSDLKTQVNHINENKLDNRAANLEWVTPSENVNHGTSLNRRAESQSYPLYMTVGTVKVLFKSAREAEERTGIPMKAIQKCCAGVLNTTHGAKFSYSKVV